MQPRCWMGMNNSSQTSQAFQTHARHSNSNHQQGKLTVSVYQNGLRPRRPGTHAARMGNKSSSLHYCNTTEKERKGGGSEKWFTSGDDTTPGIFFFSGLKMQMSLRTSGRAKVDAASVLVLFFFFHPFVPSDLDLIKHRRGCQERWSSTQGVCACACACVLCC